MTEVPPAPQGQPTAKKVPPVPAVAAGACFKSDEGWYERNKNKKFVFDADYWKVVRGIYVSGILSASTKITLGWEHKNVAGGSANLVMPIDNKINVGFVLNFIYPLKTETTMGNKTEWILGWKISHVRGKKHKFLVNKEHKVSDVEEAQLTRKLNQHLVAVEKAMAAAIEEELKSVEEEHNRVEATIQKFEQEYKSLERDIDKWTEKADRFKGDIKDYREECDNVAEKYSGPFKSLAAAAHEINADGSMDQEFSGTAKFLADSLVAIGASLIKAG